MKYLNWIVSFILIIVSYSATADFKIPDYKKVTLKNGLTVYLMEQNEVPLIDIKLVTKAGAIHDGQNYGLANLTSRALTYGSSKLSKKALEDLFAFHGAQFNTNSNIESSSASLSIAKKDLDKLLPVFRDVLLEPKFATAEFEKDKKRFISQLKQSREQPRNIIGSLFNKMYYQSHPYGNPVRGDAASIEKITLDQIKTFYGDKYSADNSALILVGDFNTNKMLKRVKKLFSGWQSKQTLTTTLPSIKSPTESNVWLVNKDDAIETTFMIGGKGIPTNHPDSVSIKVINTILGARFTSWLNDELRVNSGLTYGARSRFDSQSQAGTFAISTFTKKETTFQAIDLALKTYQKIWDTGIDKKILESAKAYVKGQFPPGFETSGQLARLLGKMWSLNLNDSYINDFQKQVDSLDVKKANEIAKANFPKDNLQFILIGRAKDIREKAKNYGKVREMDINTFSF